MCIPTYQRPQVIEELCLKSLPYLLEDHVDLYIFDSSPEDDTYSVCMKYKDLYDGFYYERMDPQIHSNEKIYVIYQKLQKKNYQYIWLWGDAVRWSKRMVESVLAETEKQYDVIVAYHYDIEGLGTKEYRDARLFHKDCAWMMTWYGATVINKELLDHIDWPALAKKYLQADSINFSQIGLFFEAIYMIRSNFYGLFISTTGYDMRVSVLKKRPGWHRDVFKVFCGCWKNAMYKLPDYYEKKNSIRKMGIYGKLFTYDNMLILRAEKIYNLRVFLQYFFTWRKVTYENIFKLFIASILPAHFAERLTSKYELEKKMDSMFGRVQKNYDEIWIYGCGYNSIPIVEYMEKKEIHIEGYLVSSAQNELKKVGAYDVVEYSNDIFNSPKAAVIISAGEIIRNEILENIPEKFHDRVFYLQ